MRITSSNPALHSTSSGATPFATCFSGAGTVFCSDGTKSTISSPVDSTASRNTFDLALLSASHISTINADVASARICSFHVDKRYEEVRVACDADRHIELQCRKRNERDCPDARASGGVASLVGIAGGVISG